MKALPTVCLAALFFASTSVYAAHLGGSEQGAERTQTFPEVQLRAKKPARYNSLVYDQLHGGPRNALVDNRYRPNRPAFSRSYPASEEGVMYYGDILYYGPPETYRSMR